MRRRSYRYHPNKVQSVVSIAASNIYAFCSGKGYGSWVVEENGQPGEGAGPDFEEKLQKLQRLYDQRLITRDEYEQKRAEIMSEKW